MSSSEPRARWLHFAGTAGSGMSALALFHAQAGGRTTGSDRAFDRGEGAEVRAALEAAGLVVTPQDGSFAGALPGRCDAVVVSTAVEDGVPDVAAARAARIPVLHRSELLRSTSWTTAPWPSPAPAASPRSRPWSSPSCSRPAWAPGC
ncbi:MAG: Mur ligase domain-containing protein [Candidatus Krumholzibacteriia bacterium]